MRDDAYTIATSNMAEVLYLLDLNNRIVDVGMETTMEGSRVFSVRFAGERVGDDHSDYLGDPSGNLFRLPFAFAAVTSAIARKLDAQSGGRE